MKKTTAVLGSLVIAVMITANGLVCVWQTHASVARYDNPALSATSDILKSVSRLRELEVKRPVKSGLKTRDQIELAVVRDLDEGTRPEEFQATAKTLVKLGLVPKNFQLREYVIKLLREQVAGFYEPRTREFYLAAWLPISEQRTVIAHELVHALQDQHFDLRRFETWPRGDSDAEMAAHALVEGEATVVMIQYSAELAGAKLDITKIASLTSFLRSQDSGDDGTKFPVLAAAPPVLRETLEFPYVYGAGFVQEVLKQRSWQALNSSYHELPASSEQIMHPDRFLIRDAPVKIDLPDLAVALGNEWSRVDADVNGEFGYFVLLADFIDKRRAERASTGWGGDRYHLYENKKTGETVLVQYTTWDSDAEAKEFFDAYCNRTTSRYTSAEPTQSSTSSRSFETEEGLVTVELRDRDVLIVEGVAAPPQLTRVLTEVFKGVKKNANPVR